MELAVAPQKVLQICPESRFIVLDYNVIKLLIIFSYTAAYCPG